jgi:catalase
MHPLEIFCIGLAFSLSVSAEDPVLSAWKVWKKTGYSSIPAGVLSVNHNQNNVYINVNSIPSYSVTFSS